MDLSTLKRRPAISKEIISSKITRSNPLVTCLEEALDEIIKEDNNDKQNNSNDDGNNNNNENNNFIPMNKIMSSNIIKKLCNNITSETKWEINNENDNKDNDKTTTMKEPPAVLLKGKIIKYNRIDNRWRIIISNAKIIKRKNVIRNDNHFCKKRKFNSLWENSSDDTIHKNNDDNNENDIDNHSIELDGLVQLLIYDDT